MKKLLLFLIAAFVLVGCSSKESNATKGSNDDTNVTAEKSNKNSSSLEDKINAIIDQQGFTTSKDIFDYEIEGNYIFVLTYHKLRGIVITTLKENSNGLKFIRKEIPDEATLLAPTEHGPFIIAIQPEDKDVKDVTAFGQPTKLIKMTKRYTEDYKQEIKCWIYVSDNIGKSPHDYWPDNDIKYIK